MNTNQKGNIALGQAIAYFTKKEYTISLPLNDSQWYDLIIEKEGAFTSVQVKYCGQQIREDVYKCKLITTSGTSGKAIYSVKDTPVDLLYCYCANGDAYLINVKDFENFNTLTLSKKNLGIGFDTSPYFLGIKESENKKINNIEPIKNINACKTNGHNPVNQYSLNGEYIATYKNYAEAGRAVSSAKNSGNAISKVCKNINKTAYGFIWRDA